MYFILFVHVSLIVLYIYCGQLLVHLCALLSSQTAYVILFYCIEKLNDDDNDEINCLYQRL